MGIILYERLYKSKNHTEPIKFYQIGPTLLTNFIKFTKCLKNSLVPNQILSSKSVIICGSYNYVLKIISNPCKVNYQITSQKCNIYRTSIFLAEIRTFQLENIDVYIKSTNEGWVGGWSVLSVVRWASLLTTTAAAWSLPTGATLSPLRGPAPTSSTGSWKSPNTVKIRLTQQFLIIMLI